MLFLLEKLFFYLFVFSIPFGTRKIVCQWAGDFFLLNSLNGGAVFNEWTSAFLYFTDILLVLLLFLWLWRKRRDRFITEVNRQESILRQLPRVLVMRLARLVIRPYFWLVLFVFASFLSLFFSWNAQLGLYWWFKLLEMVFLLFYIKGNIGNTFSFKRLAQITVLSGLFQSIIVFLQYAGQKNLGLKFLSESPFGPDVSGVAEFMAGGATIIRGYGTFPHPNVLAAFLLFCLFSLYFLWLKKSHSFVSHCLYLSIFGLLLFSLGLTYSRTIIAVSLVFSLIYLLFLFWTSLKTANADLSKRVLFVFFLFIVFSSLFAFLAWGEIHSRFSVSLGEEAVGLRVFYNEEAFSIISQHPFLGVGAGNFVWRFKEMYYLLAGWLFQPIHNLYLLIAAETGLVSLVLFLLFLIRLFALPPRPGQKTVPSKRKTILFIVFSFLVIAFFDHFFWTLQQGQLIFWLSLGLLSALSFKREDVFSTV